jgi:hypothetical protein
MWGNSYIVYMRLSSLILVVSCHVLEEFSHIYSSRKHKFHS